MPQNGDIRIFDGFRYIWMEEEGLWNPIGQVLEPPPPDEVQSDTVYTASAVREYRLERLELDELHAAVGVRMKQPSYIYCTVVANKIRYKHKVYSNDSLTDGSLNGRRFYFKYYPPPHHLVDSMMELVSTEAVHKGRLRELPATLMQKFWLENRALLYDERRDTRMYQYWLPTDKKGKSKMYVDEVEPITLTYPADSPVTRSTMLPDGTQLPDVDRVAMEEAGINASAILGSTHAFWVGRNFLINRDTRRIEAASPSLEGNIADLLRSRGVNV